MTKYDRRIERLERKGAVNRSPVLVIDTRDGIEYWHGTNRPITDAERERAEVAIRIRPAKSFRSAIHEKDIAR